MPTILEPETAGAVPTSDPAFEGDVLHSGLPVLVDFWAAWCGPCRMLTPVLEELAKEFSGRARIVKLNVDENPATASRYGIASLPTLLIFKHGKVVDQIIGAVAKKTIAGRISAQLG